MDDDRLPEFPHDLRGWWGEHGSTIEGVTCHRRGVLVFWQKGRRKLEVFRRAGEWRFQRWEVTKVGPSGHLEGADHLVRLVRTWVAEEASA